MKFFLAVLLMVGSAWAQAPKAGFFDAVQYLKSAGRIGEKCGGC